jgi:hypothetical protein
MRPPFTFLADPLVDSAPMARPVQFEHYRYLGDKRTQVVYDLDLYGVDAAVTKEIDDVLASEQFIAISPQTLAEARNRGYRPHRSILAHVHATDEN